MLAIDWKHNHHMEQVSIYDYTPAQAELVRFYDLYRCALMSKKYHAWKLRRAKFWTSVVETVAACSASSAVGSLAIWKTAAGGAAFTALLVTSAVASIIRSAFRLSESLDRHSRMALAWSELALDMDGAIAAVRRARGLAEPLRLRVDDLCERFRRVEMHDGIDTDEPIVARIQEEVARSTPADRFWLPAQ